MDIEFYVGAVVLVITDILTPGSSRAALWVKDG